MAYLILIISVGCAGIRSVFSKQLNTKNGENKSFFLMQTLTFLFCLAVCLVYGLPSLCIPSLDIALYAFLYGIALICTQWSYTLAMKTGSVSITTMIYSFGFVIPTIFGAVMWPKTDSINLVQYIGIGLIIISIVLSSASVGKTKSGKANILYFISLAMCFFACGALGVLQKLEANSPSKSQIGMFLIIAFVLATAASFIAFLFCKRDIASDEKTLTKVQFVSTAAAGLSFGLANVFNTYLASVLPAAFMFPVLNVGSIIITLILSRLIYREKLKKGEKAALILGIISIIVISIGKML